MRGVPANGVRKPPHRWLTVEHRALSDLFEAGAQLPQIRAALPGLTDEQIRRRLHHLRLRRDTPLLLRNSWVWQAMQDAIRERGPLTAAELEAITGATHGAVLGQIKRYHGNGLYVAAWRPTSRKPAALWVLGDRPDADRSAALARPVHRRQVVTNPFAVAAGDVRVPDAPRGCVYRQPMDVRDDEEITA